MDVIASVADQSMGLSTDEANRRLAQYGPNSVADQVTPWWRAFLNKFWAPIPWLLEAALLLQLGLGAYTEAVIIGALLIFNALLALSQENRADAALAALKQRLTPNAWICRDKVWSQKLAADLVPGDTIRLSLGALVPADVKIISGTVLIDRSMLTGESLPIESNPGDAVCAGSMVKRGQAIALVTTTGARTLFGRAVELVQLAHSKSTEQQAILGAVRNLAVVNGAVAALIIGYAYWLGLPTNELIRLGLTVLLATVPVALPATFTLSAALGAQTLGRRGVLLTRLTAAHEAAAMDILCSDKTGTLTSNLLEVRKVDALSDFDQARVLELAALASADVDLDPVDAAIRHAAAIALPMDVMQRKSFVPFDPAVKMSEAIAIAHDGKEWRIVKGAFQIVATIADVPAGARQRVDALAAQGHRVLAVAAGSSSSMALVGLIALSDPPRDDSAALIKTLSELGIHTVMVTGDSAVTAAAIARSVGIADSVCPPEQILTVPDPLAYGVYARVLPENKFDLVSKLQKRGHVVGMCGDGANDAPALRQAQIGIAVSTATDVAKGAAAMVLTEPGLAGIVAVVREGRIAFRRMVTYALNMLVKKIEVVLLLAAGLILTGHLVLTPLLMVVLLLTNDFLTMSLTTDRAVPSPSPSRWQMRRLTMAAVVFGICKLGFSTTILLTAQTWLHTEGAQLQTLMFVTIALGNQALLYVVRDRRHMWQSMPGKWLIFSSILDLSIVSAVALFGLFTPAISWQILASVGAAALAFAFILDCIKHPLMAKLQLR